MYRVRITGCRNLHPESQQARGVQPRVHALQSGQAAEEQSGAGQQYDRQSHLRRNQRGSQTAGSADARTAIFAQPQGQVRLRSHQAGRQAEQDSRQHRNRHREQDDAVIDSHRDIARQIHWRERQQAHNGPAR
jgi:hypothetical protein